MAPYNCDMDDYDLNTKGNRLFQSSIPALVEEAKQSPYELLRVFEHTTDLDHQFLKDRNIRYLTQNERDQILPLTVSAYRVTLRNAKAAREDKEDGINEAGYARYVRAAKNRFYNTLINLNYPHTKKLSEKMKPLFTQWLEKTETMKTELPWDATMSIIKGEHLAECEGAFWDIVDADGKLFDLCEIDPDMRRSVRTFSLPDADLDADIAMGGYTPNDKRINLYRTNVKAPSKTEAQVDAIVKNKNEHDPIATRATLFENGRAIPIISYSSFENKDVAIKTLAHELAHKFEDLLTLAYDKDPDFVTERYGFTKENRNTKAIMTRAYCSGKDKTTLYQYDDNLKEVLARDVEEHAYVFLKNKAAPSNVLA